LTFTAFDLIIILMVKHCEISVVSNVRCEWIDITADVGEAVGRSAIVSGICCISSLHTTAGITVNENADPDVGTDFFASLAGLAPHNARYRHREGNSDSHVKASLVGLSVTVPVRGGRLVLGTWQSVYFCEFDGPRTRRVTVTVLGDGDRDAAGGAHA
jgi:secondary thiamine-phosphate synthase enzyme